MLKAALLAFLCELEYLGILMCVNDAAKHMPRATRLTGANGGGAGSKSNSATRELRLRVIIGSETT